MKKLIIPSIAALCIGVLLLTAAGAFAIEKASFEEPPLYTYSLIRTTGMKEEGQYTVTRISGYYSFLNVERRFEDSTQNYLYCFGEDADTQALFLFAAEEDAFKAIDSTLNQGEPFRMTGILHPVTETAADNTTVRDFAIQAGPEAGVSVDVATFPFLFGKCYLCVGEEPQPPARPVAACLIAGAVLAAAGAVCLILGKKSRR